MQEEAAFRRTLETYLRAPANTSPGQRAALLDDIARRADRLAFVYQPATNNIPSGITVRLPIFCPPGDPDRDVRMVLTALDHCTVGLSAELTGSTNRTVTAVTGMAYTAILRDVTRQLGPHFTTPPRNPRRAPKPKKR